jgi:delta-aminolevulinic acid dehydratase/porphobilinogen synthase
MLGEIIGGLINATTAEAAVAAVTSLDIQARIQAEAGATGVAPGALVASRIRHLIDHGDEEFWVELLGVMSGSAQPGAAAIQRILARAFPAQVNVT